MGTPQQPTPVKLFCAVMWADNSALGDALAELSTQFGEIDLKGEPFPCDSTAYYQKEMGEHLQKQFFSFGELIMPNELWHIKLFTNNLERRLALHTSSGYRRTVNIDPGYLSCSQLVLATTKNYAHRIYVGAGIYQEVTLIYRRKGGFYPLDWTYVDYRCPNTLVFFHKVREIYLGQLRKKSHNTTTHSATVRFYEELNDYIPEEKRKKDIRVKFSTGTQVEHIITRFGIPITEVDLILVNGCSVSATYALKNCDHVSIYPVFETLNITGITKVRATPLQFDPRRKGKTPKTMYMEGNSSPPIHTRKGNPV
jgi:hypothetical protein